jgi:DNA polymerase-1
VILTLDTEATTYQTGHPFSRRNKLCAIALREDNNPTVVFPIEYDAPVSRDTLEAIREAINRASLVVGFNLKFDLHWLRKYDILLGSGRRLWCCQATQFVIRNQTEKYPSLNSSCAYWNLGSKLDVIKAEFWDKGLDTTDVPWELLSEYSVRDVDLTYSLFLKQQEYLRLNPKLERLVSLVNQDLEVLAEMEWNGLLFNTEESVKRCEAEQKTISEIDVSIKELIGNHPINPNSVNHVSCILYGGVIEFVSRVPYEHIYKSGSRAGETHVRFNKETKVVSFPRLVNPLPKSELAKEGLWSTAEGTLRRLKAKGTARTIIKLLLRRAKHEQLRSTYYEGWPKRISEMDWPENTIHSQLNQSVAVTGRLSSSNPNQQNPPPEVTELVESRFR